MKKKCTKCGETKSLDDFHKDKTTPDGYEHRCKTCRNKLAHQRYLNSLSPEELKKYKQKKKRIQLKNKLLKKDKFICSKCEEIKPFTEFYKYPSNLHGYSYVCRDCESKRGKKYRDKKNQDSAWVEHRRKEDRKRYHNNKKNDPQFKLNNSIRIGIYHSLKGNKNGEHWENLVGYTLNELKLHLEKQFTNEMTWENQGSCWHIDHIIPKSLFNFTKPEHIGFKKCWALDNLQPLDAKENMKKHDKLIKDKQEYLVI